MAKLFTEEELQRVTDSYNQRNVTRVRFLVMVAMARYTEECYQKFHSCSLKVETA